MYLMVSWGVIFFSFYFSPLHLQRMWTKGEKVIQMPPLVLWNLGLGNPLLVYLSRNDPCTVLVFSCRALFKPKKPWCTVSIAAFTLFCRVFQGEGLYLYPNPNPNPNTGNFSIKKCTWHKQWPDMSVSHLKGSFVRMTLTPQWHLHKLKSHWNV